MITPQEIPLSAKQIITYFASVGCLFRCKNNDLILNIGSHREILTAELTTQIKSRKQEIIKHLKAPNQTTKIQAYCFSFHGNKGAGTYITNSNEKQARQELIKRYEQYKLKTFFRAGGQAI
ncbi:hypothetical protein JYT79_00060 [Cardiobacterium sp. AH-315-I02]|nr:hypothetical protein [Cardiobacterium sp. AH-315-I02]